MNINQYKGALVGLAIGDALGATVEFMKPEQIRAQYGELRDIIGGGWLELKPGEVTDDTHMSLCVARSLVVNHGYNSADMADRLLTWYRLYPKGTGKACRDGLERFARTGETVRPPDEKTAGNGALMRILPIILYFVQQPDLLNQTMLHHAHLTHTSQVSDAACICYTELILKVLSGAGFEELQSAVGDYKWQPNEYDGKSGGYVIETLTTVLHCFFTTTSFEDALVKCVNLGGDADSTGAILGGLAGAYYGYDAVPERWKQALDHQVHDELIELADILASRMSV